MTPTIPSVFPFKVGDTLLLERQTIYAQKQQSYKQTTRTIAEVEPLDSDRARVCFKESKNSYLLYLTYNGGAEVTNKHSRYEVHYHNGKPFAWHSIPLNQLD
jgi:hypothetical protein